MRNKGNVHKISSYINIRRLRGATIPAFQIQKSLSARSERIKLPVIDYSFVPYYVTIA